MGAPARVIEQLESRFEETLAELEDLIRIPSVSKAGASPSPEIERCAEALAALLGRWGLERVERIGPREAPPYVVAEWCGAGPTRPTLLFYGHYDVQPPGRPALWQSGAFEPERRGGRLYGRGAVDDKGGILAFVAALRGWLEAEGCLPVNVKLLVEGEEEVGSEHLEALLRAQRDRLAADSVVLADTANLESGLPSITTSLRGIVNVDVEVRALAHPLHSGIWGGPVPDAASVLALLLARFFDARGQVAIPDFEGGAAPLSASEREALAALPFAAERFRQQAGLADGVRLRETDGADVWAALWRRPSLAVTALEAVPLAESANQLIDRAAARVSARLAPGQDPERVRRQLVERLTADPPFGVAVKTRCRAAVPGWQCQSTDPAFEAARRALEAGYGRAAVEIGCGGSIPFVGPFCEALGGVPSLLLGLEDPVCNAHAENESLCLDDFRSAARSFAHLLAELESSAGWVSGEGA